MAAFQNDGVSLQVTASFGVYTVSEWDGLHDEEKTLWTLCKNADTALYQAKTTGKNKVVAYSTCRKLEKCA